MRAERKIKNMACSLGADICGIAPAERFKGAPPGFNPADIWSECRSVLVFAKQVPSGSMDAESCVPYTHANTMVMREVDALTFALSMELQRRNIRNVIIPTDDPYEYWEPENSYGRAILSLKHAGHLAGLGYMGRNTLLMHPRYGNMIQLGAVLLDLELEGDDIITKQCPSGCTLCLDNCPARALDGVTVDQKKCRPLSVFKHEKGYVLKKCFTCRKICPNASGYDRGRSSSPRGARSRSGGKR
jgi:epoxyqueuosine reductase QueG